MAVSGQQSARLKVGAYAGNATGVWKVILIELPDALWRLYRQMNLLTLSQRK